MGQFGLSGTDCIGRGWLRHMGIIDHGDLPELGNMIFGHLPKEPTEREYYMQEYPKIQTVWKRDPDGKILAGEFATPELEFLSQCEWEWTEKVDGTNIRVFCEGEYIEYGGRTANAQIPAKLVAHLHQTFEVAAFAAIFAGAPVTLFGEGYGAGIQKGGGNYRPDQGFILFDVLVGRWWLRRDDVLDVASKLGIPAVPVIGRGSLPDMCVGVQTQTSLLGAPVPEGIVARTPEMLLARNGQPILAKIKRKDYA